MISAVKLERCIAGTSIFDVIVGKLRYKKKLCPVILLEIDKDLKICLHYTILLFGLAIYLQIKGSEKLLLDT